MDNVLPWMQQESNVGVSHKHDPFLGSAKHDAKVSKLLRDVASKSSKNNDEQILRPGTVRYLRGSSCVCLVPAMTAAAHRWT
jgi:hypothetical protein